MFSMPIVSVSKTQIWSAVATNKSDKKALRYILTAYSNKVELDKQSPKNAMILAVPVDNPDDIVLLTASAKTPTGISDIYKKLDAAITAVQNKGRDPLRSFGWSSGGFSFGPKSPIKVEMVGNYLVSRVRSIDEFARVNTTIFSIDPTIKRMIECEYETGYCFLVMRLQESKTYEPFAYAYPIPANYNVAFVPTMHAHSEKKEDKQVTKEVYKLDPFAKRPSLSTDSDAMQDESGSMSTTNSNSKTQAVVQAKRVSKDDVHVDWDHDIYFIGSGVEKMSLSTIGDKKCTQYEKEGSIRDHVKPYTIIAAKHKEAVGDLVSVGRILRELLGENEKLHNYTVDVSECTRFRINSGEFNGDLRYPVSLADTMADTSLPSGAICDFCQYAFKIRDLRYHCTVCEDVDECATCFGQNNHLDIGKWNSTIVSAEHAPGHVFCVIQYLAK